MEKMIEIIVDGNSLAVTPTIIVLQALQEHDIDIPALCYHQALGGSGNCGMCMVEVWNTNSWEPRHACLLPVKDGLIIKTATPRLKLLRNWAAKVLLRHRPFNNIRVEELLAKQIQDEMQSQEDEWLEGSIKKLADNWSDGCVLCGLCIKICSKVGKNRLTYLRRGKKLCISLVRGQDDNASCGNCRACSHICPTGFITPNPQQTFTEILI
ncbi:MAG: ferredoxin [Firmicutes bacterium]|nr:ferredoxin [Bacillota bacterium]